MFTFVRCDESFFANGMKTASLSGDLYGEDQRKISFQVDLYPVCSFSDRTLNSGPTFCGRTFYS